MDLDSVPKIVGMIYAIVVSVLVAVLLAKGKFNRKVGYGLLIVSSLLGFVIFGPMLPIQFQTVLLGNTAQLMAPIGVVIAMLVLFVVLAFILGRSFCGYGCPIGAVQELAYLVPVKKLRIRSKAVPLVFRLTVLGVFVGLALASSIGILKYLGITDFFHLVLSSWTVVFVGILVIGTVAYRPACRFLCPYGALLSLSSNKSRCRLTRDDTCIECKKCEEVCPTNETGKSDSKQECYLCNRCVQSCPTHSIHYRRSRMEPGKLSDLNHGKVNQSALASVGDASEAKE